MSEVTRSAAQRRRQRVSTGSLRIVPGRGKARGRRPPRPPGVGLLLAPVAAAGAAVLLAAAHAALGAPLGARFAGEVWDVARSFVVAAAALGTFNLYAYRANRAAQLPPAQDDRAAAPRVLPVERATSGPDGETRP